MRSEARSFIEEARRAQLVQCAIEAISSYGYANATMARIAKLAKASPGVISYHFGGKEQMIQAVVAEVARLATEMMEPRIVASATATEALRVYFTTNLEFMRVHRGPLLALVEIINHERGEGGRPGPYDAQHEIALADVEKVLAWGQQTGEFRDFDRRAMAIAIRGAIDAVPARMLRDPGLDLEHLAVEFATLFELATRDPAFGHPPPDHHPPETE
ncbi:AcrR family transcriptional regulator [Thermocatellispora tengchongensis]|uniref:AcrR family transcriptional regulator n=1 Tax=Thermocatellispora tengchongensis TaxID=1073253 RepID=A0A840PH55_9ACTN|nr:TetR/AcrR family transcriptional regulator [Thermocatellispora tengchongensis]MBB5138898.1 AcrR family transcriptional regulator [Thermocatellispora tengchongensis]